MEMRRSGNQPQRSSPNSRKASSKLCKKHHHSVEAKTGLEHREAEMRMTAIEMSPTRALTTHAESRAELPKTSAVTRRHLPSEAEHSQ